MSRLFTQWFAEIRVIATIIAALFLVVWLTSLRTGAFRRSKQSVAALADRLDSQVERGRYRRVDPANITETDAWGQRIRVEYREEGVGEHLIVSSAGRDGAFGTDDDIVASHWLMNAKGIGEEIHDGAASIAKQATKGAIQGVKEELKEALKRKPTKAETE
jgi:hypothetical protein